MDPWVFESGEKVWLGGRVDGDSILAACLRDEIRISREGNFVDSGYGAQPDSRRLDVDVPYLLDHWLRHCVMSQIVTGPVVEYPPERRRDTSASDEIIVN